MFLIVCAFFLFSSLSSVSAQYPLFPNGSCDGFCGPKNNINFNDISGIYYVTYMISEYSPNDTKKCNWAEFVRYNDSAFTVTFHYIVVGETQETVTTGTLIINPDKSYTMFYTILEIETTGPVIAFNTDVFALLTCHECGFFRKEGAGLSAYVFSRLPYPNCGKVNQVKAEIEACGIPFDALDEQNHGDCNTC